VGEPPVILYWLTKWIQLDNPIWHALLSVHASFCRGRRISQMLSRQMVCTTRPEVIPCGYAIEELKPDDVPEMLALAELTEPGPFRQRTIEFGGYMGIRDAGRLVAMAGQRLSLTGFTEVSAVCTHPEYRGRGYANACGRSGACDLRTR